MHSFQIFFRAKCFTTQTQRNHFITNVRAKYDMLKSAGMIFAPPLVVALPVWFEFAVPAATAVVDLPVWLGFAVAAASVVFDGVFLQFSLGMASAFFLQFVFLHFSSPSPHLETEIASMVVRKLRQSGASLPGFLALSFRYFFILNSFKKTSFSHTAVHETGGFPFNPFSSRRPQEWIVRGLSLTPLIQKSVV